MGVWLLAYSSGATTVHGETPPVRNACARPEAGSIAQQPAELVSKDGELSVVLSIRNSPDSNGNMRYCYIDEHGNQAPTLRVKPVTS
jgi:hypothetical protein